MRFVRSLAVVLTCAVAVAPLGTASNVRVCGTTAASLAASMACTVVACSGQVTARPYCCTLTIAAATTS